MLSDDESASSEVSDIHQLTVNEHFAKAYKAKKEHEELQQLKDKYGSDAELDENDDEEDSESDESEDEEGEELTPAMDVAVLRILAKIRNKDPTIYDSKKNVFEEEQQTTASMSLKRKKKDKSKPLTIKQHALNSMLEASGSRSPSPSAPITYAKEQEQLKDETIRAFKDAVPSDDSDSEDDLLVPREKTKDELQLEEEEYKDFIQREIGKEVDIRELITVDEGVERIHEEGEGDTSMRRNKKSKNKSKKEKRSEETDQDFLVNYILNRGWIDKSSQRVPTYQEVTGSKSANGKEKTSKKKSKEEDVQEGNVEENAPKVDEDDSDFVEQEDNFDDLADRFESSYNFRFEEPGADTIATYPRNLPSLVRRQDTSRKEAREKRKQRKEEEKAQKREEVNRLKALKMKEIREKIDMIQKEGGKGVKGEALKRFEEDLDEEWDPLKHDARMKELYDEDNFYGVEDDDKPRWADDIDITDIVGVDTDEDEGASKKKKRKKKKEGAVETNFGAVDEEHMDAEVEHDWEFEKAQWDGTEESRKRLMDKYMDEVYGLEFNDMIGDMPTRFKYTSVPASSFALDPVELLMASDRELNEYMSIKKFAPYRNKNKGTWDNDRNEKLKALKAAIASRRWDGVPVGQMVDSKHEGRQQHGVGDGKKKKRMGKKERNKLRAAAGAAGEQNEVEEEHINSESERPKKKRKKDKA